MSKQNFLRIFVIFLAALAGTPLGYGAERRVLPLKNKTLFGRFVRMQAVDASAPSDGKILYYQDPGHRWYRWEKPGIAADWGMKLVPVYASDGPGGGLAPGGVEIS